MMMQDEDSDFDPNDDAGGEDSSNNAANDDDDDDDDDDGIDRGLEEGLFDDDSLLDEELFDQVLAEQTEARAARAAAAVGNFCLASADCSRATSACAAARCTDDGAQDPSKTVSPLCACCGDYLCESRGDGRGPTLYCSHDWCGASSHMRCLAELFLHGQPIDVLMPTTGAYPQCGLDLTWGTWWSERPVLFAVD